MRIATEEIFGPVVTVIAFNTEDEAVAIANQPDYGLLAGIYTRDSERAFRAARRLEVGMAVINDYFRACSAPHSAAPSTAATVASTPSRHCRSSAPPR